MTTHAHMLSGLCGYMPDQNEVYATRRDAIEGLRDFAGEVRDDCDGDHYDYDRSLPVYCYAGRARDGYISFYPSHGVEYAEVTTDCEETACLEELNDEPGLLPATNIDGAFVSI